MKLSKLKEQLTKKTEEATHVVNSFRVTEALVSSPILAGELRGTKTVIILFVGSFLFNQFVKNSFVAKGTTIGQSSNLQNGKRVFTNSTFNRELISDTHKKTQ